MIVISHSVIVIVSFVNAILDLDLGLGLFLEFFCMMTNEHCHLHAWHAVQPFYYSARTLCVCHQVARSSS